MSISIHYLNQGTWPSCLCSMIKFCSQGWTTAAIMEFCDGDSFGAFVNYDHPIVLRQYWCSNLFQRTEVKLMCDNVQWYSMGPVKCDCVPVMYFVNYGKILFLKVMWRHQAAFLICHLHNELQCVGVDVSCSVRNLAPTVVHKTNLYMVVNILKLTKMEYVKIV